MCRDGLPLQTLHLLTRSSNCASKQVNLTQEGKDATELVKKVCPRLRDSACWRRGEITQPRTIFLANSVYLWTLHSALPYMNKQTVSCYIFGALSFSCFLPLESGYNPIGG